MSLAAAADVSLFGPDEVQLHNDLLKLEHDVQAASDQIVTAASGAANGQAVPDKQLQELLSKTRGLIRDLELLSEEQDTDEATDALEVCVDLHQAEYQRLAAAIAEAKRQAKRHQQMTAEQQRRELFAGASLPALQREYKTVAEAVQGTSEVTESLQRSKAMLTQQIEKTSATMAVLDSSNATLGQAKDEFVGQKSLNKKGAKLLNTIQKQERNDRRMLWVGLLLFLATCTYIGYKRAPGVVKAPVDLALGAAASTASQLWQQAEPLLRQQLHRLLPSTASDGPAVFTTGSAPTHQHEPQQEDQGLSWSSKGRGQAHPQRPKPPPRDPAAKPPGSRAPGRDPHPEQPWTPPSQLDRRLSDGARMPYTNLDEMYGAGATAENGEVWHHVETGKSAPATSTGVRVPPPGMVPEEADQQQHPAEEPEQQHPDVGAAPELESEGAEVSEPVGEAEAQDAANAGQHAEEDDLLINAFVYEDDEAAETEEQYAEPEQSVASAPAPPEASSPEMPSAAAEDEGQEAGAAAPEPQTELETPLSAVEQHSESEPLAASEAAPEASPLDVPSVPDVDEEPGAEVAEPELQEAEATPSSTEGDLAAPEPSSDPETAATEASASETSAGAVDGQEQKAVDGVASILAGMTRLKPPSRRDEPAAENSMLAGLKEHARKHGVRGMPSWVRDNLADDPEFAAQVAQVEQEIERERLSEEAKSKFFARIKRKARRAAAEERQAEPQKPTPDEETQPQPEVVREEGVNGAAEPAAAEEPAPAELLGEEHVKAEKEPPVVDDKTDAPAPLEADGKVKPDATAAGMEESSGAAGGLEQNSVAAPAVATLPTAASASDMDDPQLAALKQFARDKGVRAMPSWVRRNLADDPEFAEQVAEVERQLRMERAVKRTPRSKSKFLSRADSDKVEGTALSEEGPAERQHHEGAQVEPTQPSVTEGLRSQQPNGLLAEEESKVEPEQQEPAPAEVVGDEHVKAEEEPQPAAEEEAAPAELLGEEHVNVEVEVQPAPAELFDEEQVKPAGDSPAAEAEPGEEASEGELAQPTSEEEPAAAASPGADAEAKPDVMTGGEDSTAEVADQNQQALDHIASILGGMTRLKPPQRHDGHVAESSILDGLKEYGRKNGVRGMPSWVRANLAENPEFAGQVAQVDEDEEKEQKRFSAEEARAAFLSLLRRGKAKLAAAKEQQPAKPLEHEDAPEESEQPATEEKLDQPLAVADEEGKEVLEQPAVAEPAAPAEQLTEEGKGEDGQPAADEQPAPADTVVGEEGKEDKEQLPTEEPRPTHAGAEAGGKEAELPSSEEEPALAELLVEEHVEAEEQPQPAAEEEEAPAELLGEEHVNVEVELGVQPASEARLAPAELFAENEAQVAPESQQPEPDSALPASPLGFASEPDEVAGDKQGERPDAASVDTQSGSDTASADTVASEDDGPTSAAPSAEVAQEVHATSNPAAADEPSSEPSAPTAAAAAPPSTEGAEEHPQLAALRQYAREHGIHHLPPEARAYLLADPEFAGQFAQVEAGPTGEAGRQPASEEKSEQPAEQLEEHGAVEELEVAEALGEQHVAVDTGIAGMIGEEHVAADWGIAEMIEEEHVAVDTGIAEMIGEEHVAVDTGIAEMIGEEHVAVDPVSNEVRGEDLYGEQEQAAHVVESQPVASAA